MGLNLGPVGAHGAILEPMGPDLGPEGPNYGLNLGPGWWAQVWAPNLGPNLALGAKTKKMRGEKPCGTPALELEMEPYGASYDQKPCWAGTFDDWY